MQLDIFGDIFGAYETCLKLTWEGGEERVTWDRQGDHTGLSVGWNAATAMGME